MKQRNPRPPLPAGLRILVALAALPVLLFCLFGFLASFEPGATSHPWSFRIAYAIVALGVSILAGRLIFRKCEPDDSK